MPTYVYQVIKDDGSEGEVFEVVQKMADDALTKHPETGEPVRRIPQRPYVGGEYSDHGDRAKTEDKNLERLGFTKYVNQGGGKFEKSLGKGPDTLQH